MKQTTINNFNQYEENYKDLTDLAPLSILPLKINPKDKNKRVNNDIIKILKSRLDRYCQYWNDNTVYELPLFNYNLIYNTNNLKFPLKEINIAYGKQIIATIKINPISTKLTYNMMHTKLEPSDYHIHELPKHKMNMADRIFYDGLLSSDNDTYDLNNDLLKITTNFSFNRPIVDDTNNVFYKPIVTSNNNDAITMFNNVDSLFELVDKFIVNYTDSIPTTYFVDELLLRFIKDPTKSTFTFTDVNLQPCTSKSIYNKSLILWNDQNESIVINRDWFASDIMTAIIRLKTDDDFDMLDLTKAIINDSKTYKNNRSTFKANQAESRQIYNTFYDTFKQAFNTIWTHNKKHKFDLDTYKAWLNNKPANSVIDNISHYNQTNVICYRTDLHTDITTKRSYFPNTYGPNNEDLKNCPDLAWMVANNSFSIFGGFFNNNKQENENNQKTYNEVITQLNNSVIKQELEVLITELLKAMNVIELNESSANLTKFLKDLCNKKVKHKRWTK